MSRKQLDKFLRLLKASPSGAVFNPWWQIDEKNDVSPHSSAIRRKHLAVYFRERLGKARLAIVGEALGYRGGHFSGIPMTSERMLLGKKPEIAAALSQRRPRQVQRHRWRRGAGTPRPQGRTFDRQQFHRPSMVAVFLLHADGQDRVRPEVSNSDQTCFEGYSEGHRPMRQRT